MLSLHTTPGTSAHPKSEHQPTIQTAWGGGRRKDMPSSRLGLIEQILQSRAHDWMDGQEPIANSGKLENIDKSKETKP